MNINVTDHSFKEEVGYCTIPVLINFWAPWCGACRIIIPTLEEVAQEYKDTIKVLRVNTDENPTIAMKYNIRSIPTILILQKNEVIIRITGALPKSVIIQKLKYILNTNEIQTE